MLDQLYPTDERTLFTNRDYHLGLLEMCLTELQAGRRKHHLHRLVRKPTVADGLCGAARRGYHRAEPAGATAP